MKKAFVALLAVIVSLMPVTVARGAGLNIDVGPAAPLAVSNFGDVNIVIEDGVPEVIEVRDREYTGIGIYVTVNGMVKKADVLVASNLELADLATHMFDHEGTIDFTVGGDMLNLRYEGSAKVTKDKMLHTTTIYSTGDFKVVDGTGAFEALKGVDGAYTLTLVEHGKKVGSLTDFTFSAMEVVDEAH